jgi:hypothetical protein
MSIGQDRAGFVYVIQDGSGLCKIGRAKNVEKRIRSLSTGSSSDLTLIASWPCSNAGESPPSMARRARTGGVVSDS